MRRVPPQHVPWQEMAAWTAPHDRAHEGWFNTMSSEDASRCLNEELTDYTTLPLNGAAKWFTDNAFENVTLAASILADFYNVQLTCSWAVIDDTSRYWETGVLSESDKEVRAISSGVLLMPVGNLEQLFTAAIATLYTNGAKSNDTEGRRVIYTGPHDAEVRFKFEGQPVALKISERGPGGKPTVHLHAGPLP